MGGSESKSESESRVRVTNSTSETRYMDRLESQPTPYYIECKSSISIHCTIHAWQQRNKY